MHVCSNSAGVISEKRQNVERNDGASDDSLKRFALAWQIKTRDLTRHLSQECTDYLDAKHHFRKAWKNHVEGRANRWEQDADHQENSRTYESMKSLDKVARGPQKNQRNDAAAKATSFCSSLILGCEFISSVLIFEHFSSRKCIDSWPLKSLQFFHFIETFIWASQRSRFCLINVHAEVVDLVEVVHHLQ